MKKIDENGFWNYEANPISKVGVFPYLGSQIDESLEPDKVYYVYRPAEELFSEEAIASFNSVPVPLVDDHTMIGKDYTPAEQKGVDGVISNVRQSGDELIGDLAIYSESMKNKINHGKKDLSMGYFCSYDLTPGEWNGQHYDAVQRDIRSNHVALVKDGRCGHSVRVYDSFSIDYSVTDNKEQEMQATDAEFKESDHPRDDNGKFTSGGGENSGNASKNLKDIKGTSKLKPKMLTDTWTTGGQTLSTKAKGVINTIEAPSARDLGINHFVNKENFSPKDSFEVEHLSDEKMFWDTAAKKLKEYGLKKDAKAAEEESSVRENNIKWYMRHKWKGKNPPEHEWEKLNKKINNFVSSQDSQISEQKGVKMENLKEKAKDGDLVIKHDDEEEEKTMDAAVDKRELIREIGAIAGQAGMSDELVRTLMQKAEQLAYNGSEETKADDACDAGEIEEEIKEEEKVEDEDVFEEEKKEKEVDDEDEEEKEDDLSKSLDAMPHKIMKMIAARDSLVEQLKPIIGSFNYQSKTADQVAKYACDTLDLKVSKASEAHACIKGYLAGYKKSQKVYSMDTAATTQVTNNQIEKYLKGE